MAEASIKDVQNFFDMPLKEFSVAWKQLTDQDKADLKTGIGDGTLTY